MAVVFFIRFDVEALHSVVAARYWQAGRKSVVLLAQIENDAFFASGESITSFDGIIQRIAKDHAEIHRIDGELFADTNMRIELDPFVNSDRLFGAEDGIEAIFPVSIAGAVSSTSWSRELICCNPPLLSPEAK